MPFEFDANGAIVTQEVNGQKLPVYVHPDGKKAPFDADGALSTISARNAEAKAHREAKEAAERMLKSFEGLDPVAARDALDKLKTVDLNKLVDKGEVEKVKAEVKAALEQQYAPVVKKAESLEQQLNQHISGSVFSNSKFVAGKLAAENGAVAAQIARGLFGNNVKVEDGKPVIYDANGAKVYSRIRPGELADPEEGLEIVMTASPLWPSIAKGSGASGSGASSSNAQGGGGKKTISRANWQALSPADQAATARTHQITD